MAFDLRDIYHNDRPLSWSAISSFKWNKRQWFEKYILKVQSEPSAELILGRRVDEEIQNDPNFLPTLPRYPILQHKMEGEFDGIPLLGYADAFHPDIPALRDYKTGRKKWDKKRADDTGQITMYLLMMYLRDNIHPETVKCYIDWIPTEIALGKLQIQEPPTIKTIPTKRTMAQVLAFGQTIKDTWVDMERYASREIALAEEHIPVEKPISPRLK